MMAQAGYSSGGAYGEFDYAASAALAAAQQAAMMQQMAAYGGMPAVGFAVPVPVPVPVPVSPSADSPTFFQQPGGAQGGGRVPPMPPPSPSGRYSNSTEG